MHDLTSHGPASDDPVPVTEGRLLGVYRATLDDLYAYVLHRTGGDRDLADDATQEAYLRAVRTWRRDGLPDEPLAWLKTVARNLLLDHYQRRRPAPLGRLETDLPGVLTAAESTGGPESPEAAALIHWGLGRLPARYAGLIESFHFDGCSTAEVAARTGLSVRAVEGRLYRARRRLARVLRPRMRDRLRSPPGPRGRPESDGREDSRGSTTNTGGSR